MNLLNHYIKGDIKEVLDWVNFSLAPIKTGYCQKTIKPHPEWWIASFRMGHNPVGLFHSKRITASAGSSIYIEDALYKALGEAVERYSSVNSHYVDNFTMDTINDNDEIQFARCAWFEPCQDSFKVNGCSDFNIEHTKVKRLTTNEEVSVPAEHIHLGFTRHDLSMMHTSPISTGCAFYYDIRTAIWKGICEYIERDAMMRFWHLKKIPKKINTLSSRDYELNVRLRRIKNANLKLHLFEISSVVNIPTCYAILESNKFPYFCVGASSNTNLIEAAKKAIDESISIRMMAIWNGFKDYDQLDLKNFLWVDHLEAHMGLYANWRDCPAFDFFIDQKNMVSFDELLSRDWIKEPSNQEELIINAEKIESKGFTILWKNITTPDINKYGNAIKVVIPEMIPLSQSFSTRWLNNLIDKDNFDPNSINSFPHPFS